MGVIKRLTTTLLKCFYLQNELITKKFSHFPNKLLNVFFFFFAFPQTLLHEMIHALLFVTDNNRDRDGHGPEFCKHMNRINKASGTKITVIIALPPQWKNFLIATFTLLFCSSCDGVVKVLKKGPLKYPHDHQITPFNSNSVIYSGLPQFPWRGRRLPAALVEVQRTLPAPQALLWLCEESHESRSILPGPLVGGTQEDVWWDIHQGQRAGRIRR